MTATLPSHFHLTGSSLANPAPTDWRSDPQCLIELRRPSCAFVLATGCSYCECCERELLNADRDTAAVAFVDMDVEGKGALMVATCIAVCAECLRRGTSYVRQGLLRAAKRSFAEASGSVGGPGHFALEDAGITGELAMACVRAASGAILMPRDRWTAAAVLGG